MQYCFARSHSFLDLPDFKSPFLQAIHQLEQTFHLAIHFPWIAPIVKCLPDFLMPRIIMPFLEFERVSFSSPQVIPTKSLLTTDQDMNQQIQDIIDDRNQNYKDTSRPTVFKELLNSNLPIQEKTAARLQDEGVTLVGSLNGSLDHGDIPAAQTPSHPPEASHRNPHRVSQSIESSIASPARATSLPHRRHPRMCAFQFLCTFYFPLLYLSLLVVAARTNTLTKHSSAPLLRRRSPYSPPGPYTSPLWLLYHPHPNPAIYI